MFELYGSLPPPPAPTSAMAAAAVHRDDRSASAARIARFASGDARRASNSASLRTRRPRALDRHAGRRRSRTTAEAAPSCSASTIDVTEQRRTPEPRCAKPTNAPRWPRAHAGIGTWERDAAQRRRTGTSRCCACAASSRAAKRRATRSGWRWSTPTTAAMELDATRRHDETARASGYEFRVRLARRQLALAGLALGAGARRPTAGRCAASASTGTSPRRKRPSSRASRRRSPSARATPSRSSSRA